MMVDLYKIFSVKMKSALPEEIINSKLVEDDMNQKSFTETAIIMQMNCQRVLDAARKSLISTEVKLKPFESIICIPKRDLNQAIFSYNAEMSLYVIDSGGHIEKALGLKKCNSKKELEELAQCKIKAMAAGYLAALKLEGK